MEKKEGRKERARNRPLSESSGSTAGSRTVNNMPYDSLAGKVGRVAVTTVIAKHIQENSEGIGWNASMHETFPNLVVEKSNAV